MTFQHRVIQFDKITSDMDLPESRRDLTVYNVQWLLRNIGLRNNNHPKLNEALAMLQVFAKEIKK